MKSKKKSIEIEQGKIVEKEIICISENHFIFLQKVILILQLRCKMNESLLAAQNLNAHGNKCISDKYVYLDDDTFKKLNKKRLSKLCR